MWNMNKLMFWTHLANVLRSQLVDDVDYRENNVEDFSFNAKLGSSCFMLIVTKTSKLAY
jgi:hypothetical protein